MEQKYEDIYKLYLKNEKFYPFSNNTNIIISNFPNISQVIDRKITKLKNEGKDHEYINNKIKQFQKITEKIIENIKKENLLE